MGERLLLGAVASDPVVITIWDGFKAWFNKRGLAFDYVLYTSYERQVEELLAGRIDVAWNDPLAWVQAKRGARSRGTNVEPLAMRDIDFDLTSSVIVRSDGEVASVADLKGRTVGVGAPDAVEATLVPLSHLRACGVVADSDFTVRHFDDTLGYHGGHQQAERDAARALVSGEVDAVCVATMNYEAFLADGTLPAGATRVLSVTPTYDHCNFTVAADSAPKDLVAKLAELLFEMSRDDPEVRPYMELEWVKAWKPPRLTNYEGIERAYEESQLDS